MPTLSQLRYILAVHHHGHFGRAAEACGIAQPTLSAQIQKAEEALGITVFIRQQKPVTSTVKGAALIEQAQRVISAHEQLQQLAQGQFETIAGDFSLGIIPTLAPYVAPWFVKRFAEAYPQVNLTIVERTTTDIINDLEMRHLDAGLVAIPLATANIRERLLFHDPFYLYAASSEPILETDEIDPSSLEPDRLWLLEEGHCVRNQTLALCDLLQGCSHLSSVSFEAASFETLRYLIDASEGYTLVPETCARLLPKDRRRQQIRPFTEPTPTRAVGLVHLKSAWKTDMIDALEKTIKSTIPRPLRQSPDKLDVLPVKGPKPRASKRRRKAKVQ